MKISRQKVKDQLAAAINAGKESHRIASDLIRWSFTAAIDEDVFYNIADWCNVAKDYVNALENILNTFDQGKWTN